MPEVQYEGDDHHGWVCYLFELWVFEVWVRPTAEGTANLSCSETEFEIPSGIKEGGSMTRKAKPEDKQLQLALSQRADSTTPSSLRSVSTNGANRSVGDLTERRVAKTDGKALETVLKFANSLSRRLS